MFYKIKSLHSIGYKIKLHCFEYGKGTQKELEKYCNEIFYYKRNFSVFKFFSHLPFIVASRNSNKLLKNLCEDNAPIIFEGHHSSYFLKNKLLERRNKIVRTHNIESNYYNNLSKIEDNLLKKIYFFIEAKKLKKFDKDLSSSTHIAAITNNDKKYYSSFNKNVSTISAFHPFKKITSSCGKGKFILYHGNLGVAENNNAALYLVKEIFSDLEEQLIIIGNNVSKKLIKACKQNRTKLIIENDTKIIHQYIKKAHINILPTFQSTGLKLKLLAALYMGRFCLVNNQMVAQTGLEKACVICNSTNEFKVSIKKLMKKEFLENEINNRKKILNPFSNKKSLEKLIKIL